MQSIRVLLSFYTLIMFGISSSSAQIFRSACRRDGLFAASARDKKQTNGLISSHNILRLPLCAKKCTSTATCMTINYKYQTSSSQDLNCELLNTNLSSSLSVAVGWVHYKPVRQVDPRCRFVTCNPGYECKETCATQVGYECIDINECQSNPCLNGATCQNLVNSYSCTCVPGYEGTNCQSSINECASSPCKNGGTCSDGINRYTCACASGYAGTNCESTPTPASWETGDGTGGSEINIGTYSSKEACLRECSKRTNNGIYANGATVSPLTGSVSCFCEFGMTSRSGTSYHSAFISPSCTAYKILSDTSRHITQTGTVNCDSDLTGSYRFLGSAGTMMPTSCVTKLYCSTHAPGWLQGTHPTQAEGVVDRTACFNYSGNCCVWNRAIKVRNCGSFYVYELVPTSCSLRYCGTG